MTVETWKLTRTYVGKGDPDIAVSGRLPEEGETIEVVAKKDHDQLARLYQLALDNLEAIQKKTK